jgi:protein-tyrosine phosphatase
MHPPSRSIALSGASNFRDLGGYIGQDGRPVRWRTLFRSDHLGALTASDIATLSGLNLRHVCDFRGATERLVHPSQLPAVPVQSLAIEPTVVQALQAFRAVGQTLTAPITVGLMQDTYRAFVRLDAPQFSALFANLLAGAGPLVFHCTAGKDRTGFAAALILRALGVPHDVVLQDYLLTNTLYKMPTQARAFAPPEVLAVLWGVQPEFLDAAFEAVEADFGTVDAYLARALGVGPDERARLADLYLEA